MPHKFTTFGRISIRTQRIQGNRFCPPRVPPFVSYDLQCMCVKLLVAIQYDSVSFKISHPLTSFYNEVLYISSILAAGHTGVVTFLV